MNGYVSSDAETISTDDQFILLSCASKGCSKTIASGEYCGPCKSMIDDRPKRKVMAKKPVKPIKQVVEKAIKQFEVDIGVDKPYLFHENWTDQITYDSINPDATTQLFLLINHDWFRDQEHIRSLVDYYRSKPFSNQILNFQSFVFVLCKKTNITFNLSIAISYWNAWNPKAFVVTLSQKLLRQMAAGNNSDKYAEWKDKHEPELTKAKKEKRKRKSTKSKIDPVDIENAKQEILEAAIQSIPAIFDKRNPCCFKDGIQLAKQGEVTWTQAIDFVQGSVAYILNGGAGFFMTKTFDVDGNLDYVRVSQDKMSKSMLRLMLPNKEAELEPMDIICIIMATLPTITYGKIDFVPYAKPSDYDWSMAYG
jgi:hypothetical protein